MDGSRSDAGSNSYFADDRYFATWNFEENDGQSKSYLIEKKDDGSTGESKNRLVDNFQNNYNTKNEDNQREPSPMFNNAKNSYSTIKSLFTPRPDTKDHTKHGSSSHSEDKLLPWRNLEKNTKDDDNQGSTYYSVENFPASRNLEENDRAENEYNHGSISDLAKSWLPPWNPEENDNTADEGDRESMNDSTEKSFPSWNQKRNDPDLTSRSVETSFPSSNRKNNDVSKDLIKERKDFALAEGPERRSNGDEEENYTVVRSAEEGETTVVQDESWFSKDDEGTGGALNGSGAGERSDVKENLSRELNGQSMNELGKSFSRSYYFDVGNSFSLTLHEQRVKNDDEIGEREQSTTVAPFQSYLHAENDNVDYENTELEEENSWYNLSSMSGASANEKPRISKEKSISIERNINVELPNEIGDDFHNSDRSLDGSQRADREEGYKRGEESISGSVDSPPATRRRLAGMQEDRVVFFRGARSSAKTSELFRSRKGRAAEQDRGKILERGTSETRSRDRLPGATDPSVDFREIDSARGTFHGYQITDRENRLDENVLRDRFASTSLRGYNELFNEETANTATDEMELNSREGIATDVQKNSEESIELNRRNGKLADLTSPERWNNIGKFGNELDSRKEKSYDFGDDEEFKYGDLRDVFSDVGKFEKEEASEVESFSNVGQFNLERSSFFRKTGLHREKGIGVRRKRYTNYYSPQSVTPMAYVHIQPSYPVPAAPTPNRKCVRCMVVYKPCPSAHKPMHNNVLPAYKYGEFVSNWQGLKY
ncbi:PREDICTED: uncharacterized protein LOC108579005, partial [Habropoda laboriosa]|uniref:uncharacterized protein LOC108579005 n=1 Tax=Habropoda laboriosa TaxID=597456 RepID=UPI00083CA781